MSIGTASFHVLYVSYMLTIQRPRFQVYENYDQYSFFANGTQFFCHWVNSLLAYLLLQRERDEDIYQKRQTVFIQKPLYWVSNYSLAVALLPIFAACSLSQLWLHRKLILFHLGIMWNKNCSKILHRFLSLWKRRVNIQNLNLQLTIANSL